MLGRLTRSRATSAAIATAVNAAILYLLIVLGFQRLEPVAPTTPEIKVNLIHRDVKPFRVRPQIKVRPGLVMIRTPLALRPPDMRIKVPAQFMVRSKPVVAMTGSTVPGGAHGAFGGRVALRFTHFVAPSYPAKSEHEGNVRLAVLAGTQIRVILGLRGGLCASDVASPGVTTARVSLRFRTACRRSQGLARAADRRARRAGGRD